MRGVVNRDRRIRVRGVNFIRQRRGCTDRRDVPENALREDVHPLRGPDRDKFFACEIDPPVNTAPFAVEIGL